ncbi:unnamed protein product [Camellia sinensis]
MSPTPHSLSLLSFIFFCFWFSFSLSRELGSLSPLCRSLSFFLFLHCCSTFGFRVGVFRVRFCKSFVNESRRARRDLRNGSLGFMIGQDLPSRSVFLHYLRECFSDLKIKQWVLPFHKCNVVMDYTTSFVVELSAIFL